MFNSHRSGASDVYLLNRSTGALEQLTADARYEAHSQFSPDGRSILFHRQIAGADYAVAILDLATRAVRLVADTPGEEAYAAWSPDGRAIVFSSGRGNATGDLDLYVATPAGEILRKLTSGPAKDSYSDWSGDGRYIYFNSTRGRTSGTDVYRMEMRGTDCARNSR